MLIIGDSTVNHGVTGWTGGVARALSDTIGLAGTGMMGNGTPGIYPGRAGGRVISATEWWVDAKHAHGGVVGHAMGERVLQAGPEQPGSLTLGLNLSTPGLLDLSAAYDWQFTVAMGDKPGTLGAARLARVDDPWSRSLLQRVDPVDITPTGSGVSTVTIPFDTPPPSDTPADWHEFAPEGTTNVTIFNHRLIARERTGATVTGWGHSGHPTRDFVTDLWDNGRFDQRGRASYLSSLVYGNSGKLNVVIVEGLNDSREVDPSLTHGISPGYSPAAFADNVSTLMRLMRDDWTEAGLPPDDLSFTLVGVYQPDPGTLGEERFERVNAYRKVMAELAADDHAVSFVDVWAAGPTYNQSIENGWLKSDGVHPSDEGAALFGRVLVNELLEIPEPQTAWVILASLVIHGQRRRTR